MCVLYLTTHAYDKSELWWTKKKYENVQDNAHWAAWDGNSQLRLRPRLSDWTTVDIH